MKQTVYEFSGVKVRAGERAFTRLNVTGLLNGATLSLPVHLIHGAAPGPVLGITAAVHGAEYMPIRMVKGALEGLDPSTLKGTVIAVPICNPLSFARGTRITPDEDDVDFANLNRVFPGRRKQPAFGSGESHPTDRSLTEILASIIADKILTRLDHLIDFHAHFHHAALIKAIQKAGDEGRAAELVQGMCRALGLGLIHEHAAHANTMTGYAALLGVSACVPEIGGGGLSQKAEERAVALGVRGILNVMRYLGMVPGEVEVPARQLIFEVAPHVRPTTAGYLVSRFDPDALFLGDEPGVAVKKGQVLGTLFDPYTFQELETLCAPVEGILYLTRRSGPIEAGGHAYAVADFQGARWVA